AAGVRSTGVPLSVAADRGFFDRPVARRQGNDRRTRHHRLAALVAGSGADIDDVLAVGVNSLASHFTGQLDDVREIDELAVLRLAFLDPTAVSAPVREMVDLPALALETDVVLEFRAHGAGRLQVV